eukprot:scaffold649253_cov161-Attheya_sp.AAC.1
MHDIRFKDIAFCLATLHQSDRWDANLFASPNPAAFGFKNSINFKFRKYIMGSINIDTGTGTYHPASTSKNNSSSSSSSSSSLISSSNGRL